MFAIRTTAESADSTSTKHSNGASSQRDSTHQPTESQPNRLLHQRRTHMDYSLFRHILRRFHRHGDIQQRAYRHHQQRRVLLHQ